MDKKCDLWYISFNIKKYNCIDDVSHIIYLLDEKMCEEEKCYETNIIFKISQSANLYYDYMCKTNIPCNEDIIIGYLDYKFTQMVNQIKFYNHEYGFDWYIDYEIE